MYITQDLSLCVGCKACKDICPLNLFIIDEYGRCVFDDPNDMCLGLDMCTEICQSGALTITASQNTKTKE